MDLGVSTAAGISAETERADSAIDRVEIAAMDEQAFAVIARIADLSRNLEYATTLRSQRENVLTREERFGIDRSLEVVEEIGRRIGRLVDRCAGESKTSQDATVCDSLMLWDSDELPELLQEIDLATQWLSTATIMLLCKAAVGDDPVVTAWVNPGRPPPSYEESNFLMERREKNLRRKSSSDPSLGRDSVSLHRPVSIMESISELEAEGSHKKAADTTPASNYEQKAQLVKELAKAIKRTSEPPAPYKAYRPGLPSPKSPFTSPSVPPEAPNSDMPPRSREKQGNVPVAASIPKRWTQPADVDSQLPQSLRIEVPSRMPVPPPVPSKPKLLRTTASEHSMPSGAQLDPAVGRKRCPSLPEALVRQASVWDMEHKFPQYLQHLESAEKPSLTRSSLSRYRGRTAKRSSVQSLTQPIYARRGTEDTTEHAQAEVPLDIKEPVKSKQPVDSQEPAGLQKPLMTDQPTRPSRRDTGQAPEVVPSERPESAPEVFVSTPTQQINSLERFSETAPEVFVLAPERPAPERPAPTRPDTSDSAPELFIPATTRPAVARRIQRREALLARTANPVVYAPDSTSRDSSTTGLAQYTSVRPISTPLMSSRSSTELRPDYIPLGQ